MRAWWPAALTAAGVLFALTGGCALLGPDAYCGRYYARCPDLGPATGWGDTIQLPERVAARLGWRISALPVESASQEREVTLGDPAGGHAIFFHFIPSYAIDILVSAADPKEDAATREANQAIIEALTASPCNDWDFHVQSSQKLFAASGATDHGRDV
jgi:hypothetical protein